MGSTMCKLDLRDQFQCPLMVEQQCCVTHLWLLSFQIHQQHTWHSLLRMSVVCVVLMDLALPLVGSLFVLMRDSTDNRAEL